MPLNLVDLLDYVATCCGDPEVREALSRNPEQAHAIAEWIMFTRKRQGCSTGAMDRML